MSAFSTLQPFPSFDEQVHPESAFFTPGMRPMSPTSPQEHYAPSLNSAARFVSSERQFSLLDAPGPIRVRAMGSHPAHAPPSPTAARTSAPSNLAIYNHMTAFAAALSDFQNVLPNIEPNVAAAVAVDVALGCSNDVDTVLRMFDTKSLVSFFGFLADECEDVLSADDVQWLRCACTYNLATLFKFFMTYRGMFPFYVNYINSVSSDSVDAFTMAMGPMKSILRQLSVSQTSSPKSPPKRVIPTPGAPTRKRTSPRVHSADDMTLHASASFDALYRHTRPGVSPGSGQMPPRSIGLMDMHVDNPTLYPTFGATADMV